MHEMLEAASRRLSLHMPGAQGQGPFGPVDPYRLETTELAATDDLYAPYGAVARAEALCARSAGAEQTLMLHGGSTAGVQAMLLYAAGKGGRVVLPRNAHISALHLCAMAGLEPVFAEWTMSDGLVSTPEESYLDALRRAPDAAAMLVVRPDYYGALAWPARAVAWARAHGVMVLCDEAHGAHLNWKASTPNAGELGADMFVQSAHKTLPALNAGAWLHAMPGVDAARLRRMVRMVDTSSPSFVGLMALDDARAWMDQHGAQALSRLEKAVARFYEAVAPLGYRPAGPAPHDETRLVLGAPQGGFWLQEALAARGVDVEMADERRVVCILSLMDFQPRLDALAAALGELGPAVRATKPLPAPPAGLPPRAWPLRRAAFAPTAPVPVGEAAGRVCGVTAGLYPPGTALLTPGEIITPALAGYLASLPPGRAFGLDAQGAIACAIDTEGA